ncbi:MAG: PP2C family protein-serine/threonine phosphatase [Bacteroidota bacterium]
MKDSQTNIELLERDLYLKQLQINRLLDVTQAINNNLSVDNLYNIYKSTLNWELGIKKMILFVKDFGEWQCVTSIDVEPELTKVDLTDVFAKYKRVANLDEKNHPLLKDFDIVVPVYHKDYPIAFTFIGGLDEHDNTYEKIQFVTTITNIISVAIENKRLFKRQLEQERLKKEMELAEQMQKLLIPNTLPSNSHFELDSIYKPHLGVGGDYFDFIQLNEKEFVVCIADISGKGVAAALLMSNFQANLQLLVRRDISMRQMVELLNESVLRITKGDKFITFFIARYNIETRILTYVNAGHNPPLLYGRDHVTYLRDGCTILGIFPEIPSVDVGEIRVSPDSLLVAYTDGLTDIRNEADEFFNTEMLHDFLEKYQELSVKSFNEKLLSTIDEFRGEFEYPDDVAVVTCKIF